MSRLADLPGIGAAVCLLTEWRHAARPDMLVAYLESRQAYGFSC
jgi:hypothetical protein